VFGVGPAQHHRVGGFIETSKHVFVRTQMTGRLASGIYQSAIYLILVIGLVVLNSVHTSNFSSLGAVVLLLVRAGSYGQLMQGSYQFVRQALPFIERVEQAVQRYRDSRPAVGSLRLAKIGVIAFDRVSYAYAGGRPGRWALSDVSFEVSAGEAIGVVGPSGAGKSTMVQLLLRLRTPASGRYLINGIEATEYERQDWAKRVVYLPQQPRLIHGTVAENVRFFRPLDDAVVERACRLARIDEDILGWADGYDTIVGPRADAVSGGQQQRICLARALAGEPGMLVLDEPTSALDPRSEALIQESLQSVRHSLTLFIVAHRMSTLTICDRVMVVLNGRLNAFDTLGALQRSNDYYRTAASLTVGLASAATSL
jgi:ABC-type multidrug transport system fused ATPase/permease subunit